MIPTAIAKRFAALKKAFAAAGPVETTPPLVFAGLVKDTIALIGALDASVTEIGAEIDGFKPGTSALAGAAALRAVAGSINDELDVYEMRSFIGRVASNLMLTGRGAFIKAAQPATIAPPPTGGFGPPTGPFITEDATRYILAEDGSQIIAEG